MGVGKVEETETARSTKTQSFIFINSINIYAVFIFYPNKTMSKQASCASLGIL